MTNLPHIDTHPTIKPMLARESELQRTLEALRQPAPPVSTRDNLMLQARRLLGDETAAAPQMPEEREHQRRITELALADLRGRIQAARNQARRELVEEHRLTEQAAEIRQGIADAAAMLELLQSAERFQTALEDAEVATCETWPGASEELTGTLACFLVQLAEAGAAVSTDADLRIIAGQRGEGMADWELRLRPQPKPAGIAGLIERILE